MNNGLYPSGNGRFASKEFVASQNGVTIEVLHGLGVVPRRHKWVMVCRKTDAGYAPGDELDLMSCRNSGSAGATVTVSANGSFCRMVLLTSGNIQVFHVTTQIATTVTIANWAFKCYAEA